MGRTVISKTENKQTVILNDSADSISGGYFDEDMVWHALTEGGASWLGTASTLPSPRNLFVKLASGEVEHGEFTLEHTPNSGFTTLFEMTTKSASNPPEHILFLDKEFMRGEEDTPDSQSGAVIWISSALNSPANIENGYVGIRSTISPTVTAINSITSTGLVKFDGEASTFYANWLIEDNAFKVKFQYNDQIQFTPFLRGRTYIWVVC